MVKSPPASAKPVKSIADRIVDGTWLLAMGLVTWALSFRPKRSSDFWWHLAGGRWIVEHRAIPTTDPFSFSSQGAPWLNHSWLSDVIYYLWTLGGGRESLVYWFWGILWATFPLLHGLCRRLGASATASFLSVSLAVAVAAEFFEIRPHLYSMLLYVALLGWILPRARLPRAVLLVRDGISLPAQLTVTRSYYRELSLGGMAMRSGDKTGAEAHLRTALRLDPNSSLACHNLSLVLAWQERVPEAWAMQRHCQKIFPDREREAAFGIFVEQRARRKALDRG